MNTHTKPRAIDHVAPMYKSLNGNLGFPAGKRRGFSLVEILIVAGLLLILATAAVPNIYNTFLKASGASAKELTFQVVTAKNRSIVDSGGPSSWDGANTTEAARFSSIAPYMSFKGVTPTNVAQVTAYLGATATLTINASTVAPIVTGLQAY